MKSRFFCLGSCHSTIEPRPPMRFSSMSRVLREVRKEHYGNMRLVIVGAGGTGGYFGAKLARSGEDVTFLARGAHLKAIRENGIRIRSAVEGEWQIPVCAVETLHGQSPADLVLFCVKSFDT